MTVFDAVQESAMACSSQVTLSTFAEVLDLGIILDYGTQSTTPLDRKVPLHLQSERSPTSEDNAVPLHLQSGRSPTSVDNTTPGHEIIPHLEYEVAPPLKPEINGSLEARVTRVREDCPIDSAPRTREELVEVGFAVRRVCLGDI